MVRLRPQTGTVLLYLLLHPDRLIVKDELLQAVWPGVVVTENSLAQCIAEIRRELGSANHGAIETVPRRGYWFHRPAPEMPSGDDIDVRVAPTADGAEPTVPMLAVPEKRATLSRSHWLAIGLGVILLAAGASWWYPLATQPFVATFAAIPAGAQDLDADALRKLASGKTFSASKLGSKLQSTSWDWNADGTVCMRMGRTTGECDDSGTWKIIGHRICYELTWWNKSYDLTSACLSVAEKGGGGYEAMLPSGTALLQFEVLP